MSRKAKPSKSQAKLSPHAKDSDSLAMDAEAALGALRYRDATEFYKELVKRESKPTWVDGLAASYAGRAHELAAKGMIKEALVLWRNRAQLCDKPLVEGDYLVWLLQAGEREEMLRLLPDKSLPEAMRFDLETHLAALTLASPNDTPPGLPPDCALLRHRPFAQAAVTAYCQGDLVAMEAQLQAIPFRSPYRDLKSVLKALALLQSDVGAAREAIARLPSGGAFGRLAAVARAAALPDDGWLAALRDLDEDGRQLLLDIKGCPSALRLFLSELAKLGDAPAPGALFDLLMRFRRVIPEEALDSFLLRLLPHLGKRLERLSEFRKLPEEKRLHVLALDEELRGDKLSAIDYWDKLVESLRKKPDQKLRAALVLRHVAALAHRSRDNIRSKSKSFRYIQESLELDPDDRNSHLTVISALRGGNELTQARSYLDRALVRFPKDAGMLLEAVEVALAGKSFKKAVGLAKQVLELDPINPKVRGLIGQALFSHARKQIKAHNFAAAHKELDAAEEWLRSPTERATLKLLREFAAEGDGTLLREAIAEFGGSLVGAFHLFLEAGRVGRDIKPLLPNVGNNPAETPSAEAVVALAHVLNAMPGGKKATGAALAPLRTSLKRAAKIKFSEADHLLVCEVLQRCEEKELLIDYTKAALKRWPNRPVFVYLNVVARHGSEVDRIPYKDQDALYQAAVDAQRQGDQRTSTRIHMLLSPPEVEDVYDDDDDDDDDGFNPFDLFGSVPEDPRVMLEMLLSMHGEKAFLELMRQGLGKQTFDELKKLYKGDPKDLARGLIDMMAKEAERDSPLPRQPRTPSPKKQKDLFDE